MRADSLCPILAIFEGFHDYRGIYLKNNKIVLAKLALTDDDGFDDFADQRLKHYYTTLKASSTTESSAPTEEESDQDLQLVSTHAPHKKRKREVKESQEVKRSHESAQLRVSLKEEQRKRLKWKNNQNVKPLLSFVNPIINLDAHIGQRVKPHQLSGIQFMWQDKMRQGCLLAHTMVKLTDIFRSISLLVSIPAATASGGFSPMRHPRLRVLTVRAAFGTSRSPADQVHRPRPQAGGIGEIVFNDRHSAVSQIGGHNGLGRTLSEVRLTPFRERLDAVMLSGLDPRLGDLTFAIARPRWTD
ncbi:hypothetical protein V8E54_008082 [Elaphomyces granulatus]